MKRDHSKKASERHPDKPKKPRGKLSKKPIPRKELSTRSLKGSDLRSVGQKNSPLQNSQQKQPTQKKSKKPSSLMEPGTEDVYLEQETCSHCSKDFKSSEKVLFVEEEVGRMFCSESCVTDYFSPEIQRLEKAYYRRLCPDDLSAGERETLSHLRWITLQEPDEIWREKTLTGDYRFTLISEFKPDTKKIWCVCICLFLRGEPSFLYLAFSTRNSAMVHFYRKGERLQQVTRDTLKKDSSNDTAEDESTGYIDGLGSAWTEDETLKALRTQERIQDDIPAADFDQYQACLEETLDAPDEVWSFTEKSASQDHKIYHFIRYYPEQDPNIWYVVVARETEDKDQIEILDAFPTKDSELTTRYRKGHQEVGSVDESLPISRIVH